MNHGTWKRIGAAIAATAMVFSLAPAAFAEAVGKDGSAAINEAYEARQSLMPIGPSFSIDTLLEWTPEADPDARYNRSSIALAERVGGFVVNPKANPEAKLMLCALANPSHDNAGAQGGENFLSWAFNYWQYADSFVYWAGSEEGLIACPTGEFIDAAHTNGVPVLATLGFPFGNGTGYAQQVAAFCRKEADGSFPVADKLLEVMNYYGFDGYFYNQESTGCSPQTARLLQEMMVYMREKQPDIILSWYDSMVPNGNVQYGNAVNETNKFWMEPDSNGAYGIDEFFMNYDWYKEQIAETLETMKKIGRSPYDAFAGLDVQQNCMDTTFRDHLLLDEQGKLKLSLALYCSNSTLGLSADGAMFHEIEQDFYTNTAGDPRVETSNASSSLNRQWVGMSRFFADKTPITAAPFVTNFNSGHGNGYWVEGELSRTTPWSYQSNQDVMPTWTWIIDSEGSKLEGGYDFTDAYNGGNSIRFAGSLNAGMPNHIMLYSTYVAVESGMQLSLTYKQTGATLKLVAYYGDENTDSYEACQKVAYDLPAGHTNGWTTGLVDISEAAGKTLYALGLEVASDVDADVDADVQINLGQLAILDQQREATAAPETVTLDEILYRDAYTAEVRLYWDAVEGATSYEVYLLHADGSHSLLMETPNTALYLPTVERDAAQENVVLEVLAINRNGVRSQAKQMTIDWLYDNEASEQELQMEFVNVCLNAEITGVSYENSGEPASKALDGTADNNSKWCATNKLSGWMSIDVGREVTVRRWRVEHAEYGGEDNRMNTLDFALEYKSAEGSWVQVMRIRNNHDAVTDVLLEEPVTARYWRLRVHDDGSSAWSGIRIYEWQMFETEQFPQTESVMMHFASAVNGEGANDGFVLRNVPVGQTVTLYTKNGEEYTQIAQQVAENSTVTFAELNFGTAEAGRIYYTTTAKGSAESIKQSAAFQAESAPVSAPAENISFVPYSQPGSETYLRGDMAYTTMTVEDLAPGDVVYVYENDGDMWSKCSLPVAEGETSVSIDRVRVPWRGGGSLNIRVHRAGQQISEMQSVVTPYLGTMAILHLKAWDAQGQAVSPVVYGVYDETGKEVAKVTAAGGDESDRVFVECGTYTLKCLSVPEGYEVAGSVEMEMTFPEAIAYAIDVNLVPVKEEPPVTEPTQPEVSFITIEPNDTEVEAGARVQFKAKVIGSHLTDTTVTWSVSGATSANTQISADGWLTVGADETSDNLLVIATSNQDPNESISAIVMVYPSAEADPEDTQPATEPNAAENAGGNWVLWTVIAVVAVAAVVTVVVLRKKKA